MVDMILTIGTAIAALVMIYGAYLAIDHALFGERRARRPAAGRTPVAGELPETYRYIGT